MLLFPHQRPSFSTGRTDNHFLDGGRLGGQDDPRGVTGHVDSATRETTRGRGMSEAKGVGRTDEGQGLFDQLHRLQPRKIEEGD